MADISGFGLTIRVVASVTFPQGFDVTAFADDADPFDLPSLQIADKAMGVNGDLLKWSKANPVLTTIGVIPGSEDDLNLGILLEANRPARGKQPAGDVVNLVGIYPDGTSKQLNNGFITDGMPGTSVSSAGRQKSKTYAFAFEGQGQS